MGRLFWFFLFTVFYTYLGYPLLLVLLARVHSRKQDYPLITPPVTLLIAAHNEQAIIAEKLNNSLALDYPRDKLQILVTADGSNDRTPDIVREFANSGVELTYLPPRRGKMAAINRAMSLAQGEIVLFSDANNMYSPDILRRLVAPFADPTVGIVTGGKSIIQGDGALGDSEGLYWKYESFVKQQETRLGCCAAVAGEVMAIRRSLFEPQPDHVLTDDTHLALQVIGQGYRVIYVPEARSYERVSVSARDELTRRARIFVGRYQELMSIHKVLSLRQPLTSWQVLSHQSIRTLVPLAMIAALLTNVVAVLWPTRRTTHPFRDLTPPINWIILLLQVIFYGLAWVGSQKEQKGLLGKLLYLPTFMVNLNIAGLLGLYRFLTRRHSPLWQRAKRRESL
jgi:poly-beta-1,6-N-acetyl-D-glucosamine synthase